MKRNSVNHVLYSIALIGGLLLGGCNEESFDSSSVVPDGSTRITLTPDFAREVEVKSVDRAEGYENLINDVWVIQFDGNGNVLTGTLNTSTGSGLLAEYFSGNDITESSITLRLHADVQEIWFIANTGSSSMFSNVSNKAAVKAVQPLSVEGENSLAPQNGGIIMRGVWKDGDDNYNINDISMKRAIAKVDFTLKVGDDLESKGDAFALQSVQVMNVPNVLHYFREPDELNVTPYPALNAASDVLPYREEVAAENDIWQDLQWMPTGEHACKGEIISTNGKSYWWYLPENARGKGSATSQREKCKATAPAGQGDYCTYIRVKGYYKSGDLVSEVTYDIYLGENNTDDYSIMQNTNYKVTTTVLGIDRTDTRISKETGEEFTPINYLDYTDNSSPWIVFAPEAEGAYSWEGVSIPLENIAPWKLPTMKEMMLAWIYIVPTSTVFGTTPCWVEETTATGRWFVGMGIGEVLPPGSTASGSSDAGGSYTLWAARDISTGYSYPYVQGGKKGSNIIVSRDANGGVKENAIRLYNSPLPSDTHYETSTDNRVAAKFEVAPPATEENHQHRKTWTEAKEYCASLGEGEGWRMPTQRELMLIYIMNDQLENPLFNKPNDQDQEGQEDNGEHIFYWTGTTDRSESGDQAWSVCFCTHESDNILSGKVEGYSKEYVNYVRCVRDVE